MEYRALSAEEFDDISSRILHEDNHLLIFNKRAGEIVQGDKTGDEALVDTLKAFIAARDRKPGKVFLGVPHRLDRPVSGICVFAKTSKALERLNAMFREGRVHKTYWALCADGGVLGPGAGEESGWTLLENALVRNEKQNKSYVAPEGAKNAKMPRSGKHPQVQACRGGTADGPPPSDSLPAQPHRLYHQGRLEIWSAPLES